MSKLIIEFNVKYKDRDETKWAWLPSVVVDQQDHICLLYTSDAADE